VKKIGCLILATALLVLIPILPAHAQRGRQFSGQQGFAFKGNSGHGFNGHHGGAHRFSHSGAKVFVGVGVAPIWWGWPGWAYPYPYYPYYSAPVVVQQAPPVYIQQDQPAEPYYCYYCEGAQAYYPYVQQCPNGWMKVVPPSNGPKPN